MTTNDTFEDGASPGLREHHIDAFLEHLRQAGYSEVTLGVGTGLRLTRCAGEELIRGGS